MRELGIKLGLPKELVWRQPFPGPGLAVRILCAEQPFRDSTFNTTNDILDILVSKNSNHIELSPDLKNAIEQISHLDLNNVFATLLPVQTVGVQGDCRTYNYIAALSGAKNWKTLSLLAAVIPQVLYSFFLYFAHC